MKKPNLPDVAKRHFGKMKLTFRGGMLCQVDEEEKPREILTVPDVAVTAKAGFEEKLDGNVEYTFLLSAATDAVWRDMFFDTLTLHRMVFDGNKLKITCTAQNIAPALQRVVATCRQINEQYDAVWELVKQMAIKQDEEREAQQAEQARRRSQIQESYDRLEIPKPE